MKMLGEYYFYSAFRFAAVVHVDGNPRHVAPLKLVESDLFTGEVYLYAGIQDGKPLLADWFPESGKLHVFLLSRQEKQTAKRITVHYQGLRKLSYMLDVESGDMAMERLVLCNTEYCDSTDISEADMDKLPPEIFVGQ